MLHNLSRKEHRGAIHARIRRKLKGSAERPRLCVFRSLKFVYAQLVDDDSGRTLVAASSQDKECAKHGKNIESAKQVGALLAKRAQEKGIAEVVFDRGGYLYHGRVKALAEAARAAGLKF